MKEHSLSLEWLPLAKAQVLLIKVDRLQKCNYTQWAMYNQLYKTKNGNKPIYKVKIEVFWCILWEQIMSHF